MILLLLLGLLLVGSAVILYVQAFSYRRRQTVQTLAQIERYGFQPTAEAETRTRSQLRLMPQLDALAGSLGTSAASYLGHGSEDEMQRLLRAAGIYTVSPRKLLGYRLLALIGLPLLWLVMANSAKPTTIVFGLVFAILLGWQGPLLYLRRRARIRLEEIDFQMPELIDLLVTTVEAGVGFSGSLQLASQRFHGALGQELRLTLAEQDMGLSTEEALQNMLRRAETPAMRSFVRSVLQGETLGVSIGKIMRDLADEMRKRRRQKAEERAQKAPTKMLFPLIFLIFPAMFVILIGPAIISIIHSFKGV
jgi:tight adherence protein C